MLTAEQRKLRRGGLGSSDSAAIHRLCEWQTDHDVWLAKQFPLRELSSEVVFLGNYLEPMLIGWAREQTGVDFAVDIMVAAPDSPVLVANFDGVHERVGCEAKTRGLLWPGGVSDEWGADGSGQVPADVFMQCQHQCYVGGLELVWVPALIGGKGRRMYRVQRADDQFMRDMVDKDHDWWERHITRGERPASMPSLSTARRIIREADKPVRCHDKTVNDFLSAKRTEIVAKKRRESAEAQLLAELGDGDQVEWEGPSIPRRTVNRGEYTVKGGSYDRWFIPKGLYSS